MNVAVMADDEELVAAFVSYAMSTGSPCSDDLIGIVTAEILKRGSTLCDRCGGSMRAHVLATLRAGGKRLDHKFACVGQ